MEIVLAALSWLVTILFPLLILSAPVSLVLDKTVNGWKDSKGAKIYKLVQQAGLGVLVVLLMIVIVTMLM